MKRTLISFMLIISAVASYGQIKPPKQIDTLIITSLRFDGTDLENEEWPFHVIYKSKSDFVIGDRKYEILEVNKWKKTSHFTMAGTDDSIPAELWMTTGNIRKVTIILFEGYEISCISNRYIPVERYYSQPSVSTHSLEGREVEEIKFPEFLCHGEGEVSVIVQVDRSGRVISTKIMDEASESNRCLRFFAQRSASMSRFAPAEDGPEIQFGEIIYNFRMDKSSKRKKSILKSLQ